MRIRLWTLAVLFCGLVACSPSDESIARSCQSEAAAKGYLAVSDCIQRAKHDRDKPAWSETARLFGR